MMLTPKQIESYSLKGFLVLDDCISQSEIDGTNRDLEAYWHGNHSKFSGFYDGTRLQDAWVISQNVHSIAINARVLAILEQLYKSKPRPFQTLNFVRGSQQDAHVDYIHFNSEPFGMMCGVWVALEDVGINQGPLEYYPGSQLLEEISFESAGLVAREANYPQYIEHLKKLIEDNGLSPELALIKRGQLVIWSASTFHGGIKQHDLSLSRLSQVTHYYFEGSKYWRPFFSEHGRAYFRPNWIPATPGPAALEMARKISNGLINRTSIAAKRTVSTFKRD